MDNKTNIFITYSILSIWGLLFVFGIITLIGPKWLSDLSDPGKNIEAISLKNHGDNFLKLKKYNLAIAQYAAALNIVPDLKSAIANLGIAYQKTGNLNKAVNTFNKLLTLNPEYPGIIYYNLGEIYEKAGKPKKSLAYFLKAASNSVSPERSYQKAGQIYMEQKDWENAIINFKLSIANKKDMKNAYLIMLLVNQESYTDTSRNYKEIADIIETKSYLQDLSKFDNNIFIKQLNSDNDLAKTYNNTGYCLALLENYTESKEYLKKAIKINPVYNEAVNNLKVVNSFLNE